MATTLAVSARASWLGNGVRIDRTFDSETFLVNQINVASSRARAPPPRCRISNTLTIRAGNIAYSVDQAHMPDKPGGFLRGLNVSPESECTYDALYQLTQATGRVHQALLQNDHFPGAAGATKGTRHLTLNNGAAVERYTRIYEYDLAGNLKSISHQDVTRSWRTALWISARSNRSLATLDPAGNPVTNPESRFDANGNCIYFPFLRAVE